MKKTIRGSWAEFFHFPCLFNWFVQVQFLSCVAKNCLAYTEKSLSDFQPHVPQKMTPLWPGVLCAVAGQCRKVVGSSAVEGAIFLDFGLKAMFHLWKNVWSSDSTSAVEGYFSLSQWLNLKLNTLFRRKISMNELFIFVLGCFGVVRLYIYIVYIWI